MPEGDAADDAAAEAPAASDAAMDAAAPDAGLNAASMESSLQRVRKAATSAQHAIGEVEVLRRALNAAMDEADLAAKREFERREAERRAREPTERMKDDLKWALFDAVWRAADTGKADEVGKILSKKGADANVRQKFGVTPLHRAARLGNLPVCEMLIRHGADPTLVDTEHDAPSQYAAGKGHHAVATLLKKWEEDARTAKETGAPSG